MKRNLFTIAAILCVGLLFSSCSKDVVHDGGDSQAVTSVFDISKGDWDGSNGSFTIVESLPELTTSITDLGAVWIYFSYDGGNHYELLPSIGIQDDSGNVFDFAGDQGDDNDDTDGYITLYANGSGNAAPNKEIRVKVVSIPSTTLSSHPNVNKADYNAVKRAFNLK